MYNPYYGVLECYEGTLYDIKDISLILKIINEEDKDCKYTIPLIMLFINELFGKTRFKFDRNYLTFPNHYYNPYNNYKLCCNYNCGINRLLEFYISNDIDIVKYLKYALFPNKELLNIKLWTSENLNELRYIIKKKILYNKFQSRKNMNYFLDGIKNKHIIPASEEINDEEYLDEQLNENYNYYNFNGQIFSQNNFFQYINKIECI